jgi:DNA-binding MarR family transcriptional regulator
MPEWRVMAVLADSAPLSQIDLVRVTWMDKVAVNRACKALHNGGYLRRSPHVSDRRSHRLELSDEGLARFEELWLSAHAAYEKIFAVLDVNEIEFLREISEKILRSAILAAPIAAKVCASRGRGRAAAPAPLRNLNRRFNDACWRNKE